MSRSHRSVSVAACTLLACSGCGFKGPLYLPERHAAVVTHPAPAAQPAATPIPAEAPSPQSKRKSNRQNAGSPPDTTPPTP